MGLKTGLELEFHLIDGNGNITNMADEVINSPQNNGGIITELSKSMVEVIAPPGDNLDESYTNFFDSLKNLDSILEGMNLMAMPSSSIGPEPGILTKDFERERGLIKRQVIGDYRRDLEHHICGTHIHIDRPEGTTETYNQFNAFLAMDPLFALMASTPFFLGKNSKKDHRVDVYRNHVFVDMPVLGQLLQYPESFEGISELQKMSFKEWRSKADRDSVHFNEFNTMWGPLRLAKKTIESRASDANLFTNVKALGAAYLGVATVLLQDKPEVYIDHEGSEDPKSYFVLDDGRLILPPYSFLKYCERNGINKGIEEPVVTKYLNSILATSEKGLEKPEHLEPFYIALESQTVFADDIIGYAKRNYLEKNSRLINEDAASEVRMFIAERYKSDLYNN